MGEEDLSRAGAHDWTATLSGGVDAVVGIADVSESGRAQGRGTRRTTVLAD